MTRRVFTSSAIRFPSWQRTVEAALHESDSQKLLDRVHAAEAAIFTRLEELGLNANDASHEAECQAITDSCKALYVLKRDKLGFPDGDKK